MPTRTLVVDADSHKCENPPAFADFVPPAFRARLRFVRDRFGEQRFELRDREPRSGELVWRTFLQPEGYAKGTFRPYHEETTLGGLFNRVRIAHMDREGIDHQVIYGSVALAFNSLWDAELASALCRAYNDYIVDDCGAYAARLHPVAHLALQDPVEALHELRRCVLDKGMVGAALPPNLPAPHPDAPNAFPAIRVPRHLSHPDFAPLLAEAERLGVALGIHGAPGLYLAGGTSDQLDSFTLVHVFANRSMQQMALAKLLFDGTLERFPALRVGFLEAGVGWLPDLLHNLHEHWEKRVAHFDPSLEPSVSEFLLEFARERDARGRASLLRKARQLLAIFSPRRGAEASPAELAAFRDEHPRLTRDPLGALERGQLFFTYEPDDPAPGYLRAALGPAGERLCGVAIDYGHWDATLKRCLSLASASARGDEAYAARLLGGNALAFYGERLARRVAAHAPFALSA
ncbi:MAG TPA: amidohydrolase family protein [Myxococcota bacterium]|jgi:predicted TIM-barrel fold metal-dependent hydrolase